MSAVRYRNQLANTRQIKHTRLENDTDFEQHYTYGTPLGKGSFGTVTEAIQVANESKWAVKVINKEKAGSAAVKLLEREVAIMKKVEHPNIIHLEEVLETNTKMYLVMELCNRGGLEELLLQKETFSEQDTLAVMQQLVDAVAFLHENDIIHRDLKLDNILLAEPTDELPYNIKLTDFGLSYTRGGSGSDYMMNQVVGTPIYMAPEVITNYGYSQQCDIWSVGVIFFKLITGEAPFMASSEEELFELIKKGDLKFTHKKWNDVSQAAKQLIEGMMKVDPAHRLTSKEILFHPWIKGQQEMNGSITTNVLEMMKEYSLEQKRLAELKKTVEENNNTEISTEDTSFKECGNNNTDKLEIPTKSSETKISQEGKRTPSCHSIQKQNVDSSSRQPGPSKVSESTKKTRSVPSYMQPTKSSSAPKNSSARSKKKTT